MSQEKPDKVPERPRQVTMAGWVGGAASLMLLLTVFTTVPRLRTIETRDAIREFLNKGSGRLYALDLDQALVLVRIGLYVAGVAAAATLVFTVFALRRDPHSRVALTVLAVPILVCGVFIDAFLAGFILVGVGLLWTGPASDWFAGREPRARLQSHPPPLPPLPPRDLSKPSPFGSSYGRPSGTPAPPASHLHTDVPSPHWPAPTLPRPASVVTACAIAAITSAMVGLLLLATVLLLANTSFRQQLITQVGATGRVPKVADLDAAVTTFQVLSVVAVAWCVLACVLAAFAYVGRAWARAALAGSATMAGLLALVSAVAFPGSLLFTIAAVAVVVLLFRADSSRWYASVRRR